MTSDLPALRGLVIYGICAPLAVMLGYLLANPIDWSSMFFLVGVLGVLSIPILLKWHQPLLILSWNSAALVFAFPGRPTLWLVMAAVSLTISVLQLMLVRRMKFVRAPTIARPLIFLAIVVLVTARFTGGIGFRTAGSELSGGVKYLNLLGAIMAYFALTARRIPSRRATLYCGMFFLSGVTSAISNLVGRVNPAFNFVFWMFPPTSLPGSEGISGFDTINRITGLVGVTIALVSFLLSRYGLRGILLSGRLWRGLALAGVVILGMFSGFRSMLVLVLLVLGFQFYLEGLFKSPLLPVFLLGAILGTAVLLPSAQRLPRTFQRALAFLPVEISPQVRADAEATSEWRVKMWHEVLPEVPKYLLLGKGYAVKGADLERAYAFRNGSNYDVNLLAGTYHNGPLTVVMPFGVWGAIGFLWLLWAGGRLLYFNYRFGDPALRNINTFLFAAFLAQTVYFFFVFGSLDADMYKFVGMLGMSVALNGGVSKRVRAPAPAVAKPIPIRIRPQLAPARNIA